MPNLVSEFNKEEIIKAMEYLDIHPEEFRGRDLSDMICLTRISYILQFWFYPKLMS